MHSEDLTADLTFDEIKELFTTLNLAADARTRVRELLKKKVLLTAEEHAEYVTVSVEYLHKVSPEKIFRLLNELEYHRRCALNAWLKREQLRPSIRKLLKRILPW